MKKIALLLILILASVSPVFSQTTPVIPRRLYLPIVEWPVFIPTVTPTSTLTPTSTSTPTPTPTVTPTPTPTSTATPEPEVVVLSDIGFVPSEGSSSYYIVGEVLNNTPDNVQFVRISVTLRDGNNTVVGSDFTFSTISNLSPNMRSPFRAAIFDPPEFESYELVVTWDEATSGPAILEILSAIDRFDDFDSFHVVGEVKNQYDEAKQFVKIVVTMYDAEEKVVGVDFGFSNPDEIAAGQTASFDTSVFSWAGKPDRTRVSSYRVVAVSN